MAHNNPELIAQPYHEKCLFSAFELVRIQIPDGVLITIEVLMSRVSQKPEERQKRAISAMC